MTFQDNDEPPVLETDASSFQDNDEPPVLETDAIISMHELDISLTRDDNGERARIFRTLLTSNFIIVHRIVDTRIYQSMNSCNRR
jgi:hypothetical protein